MFHPKALRILKLCFRTTFYHKITTSAIITGFLTKLAVILCTFWSWLSTSDFSRNSSSKSALQSWLRVKVKSKSKSTPLRDRKSCYLFFYSKADKIRWFWNTRSAYALESYEIIHRIIKCIFSEISSPKFQKLIILEQNNWF